PISCTHREGSALALPALRVQQPYRALRVTGPRLDGFGAVGVAVPSRAAMSRKPATVTARHAVRRAGLVDARTPDLSHPHTLALRVVRQDHVRGPAAGGGSEWARRLPTRSQRNAAV